MPRDVPQSNYLECKAYGAHVTLVDGLISDCGRIVAEQGPKEGWFDVSTLKELALRWAPSVAEGFRKNSAHLAVEDVRDSIRELQYYRERLLRPF